MNKDDLFQHIKGSLGNHNRVFRKAGVSREEAEIWLKQNNLEKEFEQKNIEELDRIIEAMELKLIEKGLSAWDVPAIKKFLEAKAQHLGYRNQIDLDQSNNFVNINFGIDLEKFNSDLKPINVNDRQKSIE